MRRLIRQLWREEAAQDLTEYGLLLVLIALFIVAAMKRLGSAVNAVFTSASSSLSVS